MDKSKAIKKYLVTQIIDTDYNRLEIKWLEKLSYIQKTPKSSIKTRTIQWKAIPYVEIDFVERALNFISNFQRGYTIIDKWIEESNTEKDKTIYEARVQIQCYIILDWNKIEKWSFGSRKQYKNIATNKFDVFKSAESNAIKNFALTLWIWADKKREENEAIKKFRDENYSEEEAINWFTTKQ